MRSTRAAEAVAELGSLGRSTRHALSCVTAGWELSPGVAGEADTARLAPVAARLGESDATVTTTMQTTSTGLFGQRRATACASSRAVGESVRTGFSHGLIVQATRRPNHALQRTRPSRRGCNPTPSWAGSLSLGR